MTTNLTLVVAGLPALAGVLEQTGTFARVLPVGSTADLRALLATNALSGGVADKVFVFADTTPVNTPQTLPFLLSKLTGIGARVIILACSPLARDLVRAAPGVGLLEGSMSINILLGAISGLPGMPMLEPFAVDVPLSPTGEPLAPVQPAAAAQPAPVAAPAAPFPAAPAFGPPPAFGGAAVTVMPDQQMPAASPAAPVAPQPAAPVVAPQPVVPQLPAPVQAPAFPAGPAFGGAPAFQTAAAPSAPAAAAPVAPPAVQVPPASAFGGPAFGSSTVPAAPAFEAPSTPAPQPAPRRRSLADAAATGGAPVTFDKPAAPPFGAPATVPDWARPATDAPALAPRAQTTAPAFGAPTAIPGDGPVAPPVARAGSLSMNTARPARRGMVITVTAAKGGTGKSTLSLNLAAYLGLRLRGTGQNVCLIDANVQQADSGKYLNAFTPNIESVLKDPSSVHPDRINSFLLHKPELNLSVLLGPATPEAANPLHFTGKRYSQILDALKPNYDYLIIDTPVAELYHDIFREFALPRADFVVVTITPNVTTLMNNDAWLRQVTASRNSGGMGLDANKVGIVLNRAEDDIGCSEEEVRRELADWKFLGSIPETKEWKRCNNEGKLVATKNYHELNEAFSLVLAEATGNPDLRIGPAALPASGGGIGSMVKRILGRGH